VTQGIQQTIPDLDKYMRDDWQTFNPSQPDVVTGFRWFESPSVNLAKPDGN